jgi:putative ABC transport system permease protein
MLGYYLKLAIASGRSTPLMTSFVVLAIAIGVAVPTLLISVHHLFAQNPIPHKSDLLHNVRVDSWDPDSEFFDILPGDPPKHITYRDMRGLMASEIPEHETGVAAARIFVFPDDDSLRPYQTVVRLCHADFFPMFDVPFRYGSGWGREIDESLEHVVVLSKKSNDTLFGGRDSVGETVRLGEHRYTIVGVLDHYLPSPQYYDIINNPFGEPREFFVPFDLIRDQSLGLVQNGDTDSWGTIDFSDPDAVLDASEMTWIQYWVELQPQHVEDYRAWVDTYTLSQKELGRFPRPLNNRVTPLMEWMEVRGVVPPETVAMVVIALLFLIVCCLNLTGLMLTKFLSRAGHIGVHRAMGASKLSIFFQRLLESELVAVAGGLLGLVLAAAGLEVLHRIVSSMGVSAEGLEADGFTFAVAVGLSLVAGVISGLYPAWRACRIAPAIQLKVQ